ncbi:MAG: DUF177 domain-containing protein [Polyangiaceae bacterium]|nr:DUF177 domain-containing protein [Polyangiaceae bacterium]
MQPLIVVPANDIDAAGMDLSVDLPQTWLDTVLEDAGAHAKHPGQLKGRLSRSGKADIVVRAKVAAELEVPCARCLGPSNVDVRAELSLLLKPRSGMASKSEASRPTAKATAKPAGAGHARSGGEVRGSARKAAHGSEYEFSSQEADLDEYDGEKVVLDEFVREAILLELPSFPLCTEDCEGGARANKDAAVEAPATESTGPTQKPFAALRHLLAGQIGEEGAPPEEGATSPRPLPADIRRINRAKKRAKPKIRTSAHRAKK